MTRTGIRGGDIRSLDQARALTELHKPFHTDLIDRAIRDHFASHSQLHADDLAHLELPPEHLNLVGSRIARLVNRREIVEVGRRKSRNPASNGRRSGIFELTPKGIVGLRAEGRGEPRIRGGAANATPSSESGEATATDIADAPPEESDPPGSSGAPDRLFELEPVRPGHDREAA